MTSSKLRKIDVTEKHIGRYMLDSFQLDVYESLGAYEAWLSNPTLKYPYRVFVSKALKEYTTYQEFLDCSCEGIHIVIQQYMELSDAWFGPHFDTGNTYFTKAEAEEFPELETKAARNNIPVPTLNFMIIYKEITAEDEPEEDSTNIAHVYVAFSGENNWK